jgi:hypothetical protein
MRAVRLDRWLPLLAALAAAACGSSTHSNAASSSSGSASSSVPGSASSSGAGSPIPSDPTRAVEQALAALSKRSFEESFHQVGRLHVTGVSPPRAAQLDARLRGAGSNETGVVQFKDVHNFQAKLSTSQAGSEYFKAAGGTFEVSSDGVNYQSAPANLQKTLAGVFQSGFAFLSRGVQQVHDKGPRAVNGTAAEEYTGTFSGSAVLALVRSLTQPPCGSSIGNGTMTVDIDRATDLPLRMTDAVSLNTDLATLHQPGLTGRLVTVVTSTRTFSHFGPPH